MSLFGLVLMNFMVIVVINAEIYANNCFKALKAAVVCHQIFMLHLTIYHFIIAFPARGFLSGR